TTPPARSVSASCADEPRFCRASRPTGGRITGVIVRRVAVVFLVDPRGRVLMQHRDSHAKVSPNQWAMPGGKIEDGETPEEAALREVWEEEIGRASCRE